MNRRTPNPNRPEVPLRALPGGARELAGEPLPRGPDHAVAERREGGDQAHRLRGQRAALRAPAADVRLDQGPADHPLRLLDAPPDVAVALAQVGGRLLDRADAADGLEDLAEAQAE